MPLTLTAAKRSTVVHVISTDPAVGAGFTACGRRIDDDWQGEYTEAPTGPVTCKGACSDVAAAHQAQLESAATYRVGEHVGILTGLQSVTGAHVGSYGRVVRIIDGWNGKPDYVVQTDDGRFVYPASLLRAGTTNGTMREAVNRPTVRTRAQSMAAHPAGKGRTDISTRYLSRSQYPPPVPTSVASIRALLDSNPWAPITADGNLDGARNRYDSSDSITYRHPGMVEGTDGFPAQTFPV